MAGSHGNIQGSRLMPGRPEDSEVSIKMIDDNNIDLFLGHSDS